MSELTQAQLKKLLHYCPDTGIFTWLPRDRSMFKTNRSFSSWNSRYANTTAGSIYPNGYVVIIITDPNGKKIHYRAHRLAWLYVTGRQPKIIDHENRDRKDNRFSNLNNTTIDGNNKNLPMFVTNTSGITGVAKQFNKWVAQISVKGVTKRLGSSESFFEACCIRKSAEAKLGFHPNHGRK